MKVVTVPLDAIKFDARTQRNVFFNSIVLLHSASHKYLKNLILIIIYYFNFFYLIFCTISAGNTLWQPTYGDYSPIADSDVLSALGIILLIVYYKLL